MKTMIFRQKRGGYTMVELLVVMSIIAVISVIALLSLRNSRSTTNIQGTTDKIVSLLREARSRTLSGSASSTWGVHFENSTTTAPFYALFSGISYGAATSTVAGRYPLPGDTCYIDILPGGSLDIAFARDYIYIDGAVATGDATLRLHRVEQCTSETGYSMTNWRSLGVAAPDPTSTYIGDLRQFIYNGYWYRAKEDFAGGANATETATFYYAQINSDGTISPFSTATSTLQRRNLDAFFYYTPMTVNNGYLYMLGGGQTDPYDGSCDGTTTTINFAQIHSDGALGPWAVNATQFPSNVLGPGTVAHNGYIYLVGSNECWSNASSSVYYTSSTGDGTLNAWQLTTPLPNISWDCFYVGGAYVYEGYIYAGCDWENDEDGDYNVIYRAPINANGTLGAWVEEHPFNNLTNSCPLFINNGHFYALEEVPGIGCYPDTSDLYHAEINPDGSIDDSVSAGQAVQPTVDLSGSGGENTGYFHGPWDAGSTPSYGRFVDISGATVITVGTNGIVKISTQE